MIATLDMPVSTATSLLKQGQNGHEILMILDSIVTESPEPHEVDGYTGECDVDMNELLSPEELSDISRWGRTSSWDVTNVHDDEVNELMYQMENDYNDDVE